MPDMETRLTSISLREYVRLRNGVPLGAPGSLSNMLKRSLGASSFAEFWRYWNPIFGYYLGTRIYRPLRRSGLPVVVAVIATFLVSGAIHDLAASLVTQRFVFVCTPFFLLLSLGVVVGNRCKMDLSSLPWRARAATNAAYVLSCLLATLSLDRAGRLL